MASEKLSRRQLLVLGGATCAVGLLRCGSGVDVSLPATVNAGAASTLAVGSLQVVNGYSLAVGRDSGGYYAMSLICTHQGCDMTQDGTVSASQIVCTCHGSVFDKNGNVLRGPANSALAHFAVTVESGNLIVHGDQQVSSTTRVAA